MLLAILAVVTATFQPVLPTVGDRITIEFPAPVVLDASPDYEVVSQRANRVVVRTFTPKPFSLSGTTGGTRFRNLRVPVRSVLGRNDDMKPAPLTPPRPVPYRRLPFVAIGAAAAGAAAVWLFLLRSSRPAAVSPGLSRPPDEVFRESVLGLLASDRQPLRWAGLADATRRYLARTRPGLGSELTTTEVTARLAPEERFVAEILGQGDLEKFSVAGPRAIPFEPLAARALGLIPQRNEEETAA